MIRFDFSKPSEMRVRDEKQLDMEIKAIIEEEVLPFFEIVEITSEVSGVCKEPDDDKFIACALSASADFIVSGDKDFCDIVTYNSIKIIKASHLLKMID